MVPANNVSNTFSAFIDSSNVSFDLSASIDNLSVGASGLLSIGDGRTLTVNQEIEVNGELHLDSIGQPTGISLQRVQGDYASISGSGRIIMSDRPENRITGKYLGLYGVTIEGAGTIGDDLTYITNKGEIIATGANPLIVDYRGSSGPLIYNDGVFRARGSGGLVFPPGLMRNRGQLIVESGSSLTRDGPLDQLAGVTSVESGGVISSASLTMMGGKLVGGGLIQAGVTVGGSAGGTVEPGDDGVGTLTINGSYTQNGTGVLVIELDAVSDRLAISGAASLTGRLRIVRLNNFDPPVGSSIPILTAASRTGSFLNIEVPCIPGKNLIVAQQATGVTIFVGSAPSQQGDLNCDCNIDLDDVSLFALALVDPEAYVAPQPGCGLARADMNGDSVVDGNDLALFTNRILD